MLFLRWPCTYVTLWDHTFGTIRIDEVKFDMASKRHNAVSTGHDLVTMWWSVVLLHYNDFESTQQHDVMQFEYVLWRHTMYKWVINIHYQTWIAQRWFINTICTPLKQLGMCYKILIPQLTTRQLLWQPLRSTKPEIRMTIYNYCEYTRNIIVALDYVFQRLKAAIEGICSCRMANMPWRTCVFVKQMQSIPFSYL